MSKLNKRLIIVPIILVVFLITFLVFKKSNLQNITLDSDNVKMYIGQIYTIVPKEKGKYKFESEDDDVAVPDEDGNVIAKSVGETVIKVTSDKGYETECKIAVESMSDKVKFTSDSLKIELGEKEKLTYKIDKKDYEVRSEKWTTNNDKIISIKDGKIEAKKTGNAIVTLTINELINIECNVDVVINIDKIEFDKSNITIEQGEITALDYSIKPKDATEKELTFKSDNEKVVTVDKYGNITGREKGTANITVESSNGKKDSIKVKVKEVEAKSISLDKKTINLYKNKTNQLTVTIKPANTSDTTIKWSSSNNKVATVDNDGKITAKAIGKTIITAKTANGKKATSTVYVRNNTYNKTAIFFGDSITYGLKGTPVGYGWPNYIGDHFEIGKTINEGHSGWFISNSFNEKWINSVVKKYNGKSYDYVILHGGTNDISKGVALGTFDAKNFSGNYDTKTFLGGLETYIYTVKKQFPKAKIGYIINYETPNNNSNRKNLSASYYTEMKKVLEKWKIPYLDLFFGSAPNGTKYSDILKVNTTDYLPDTLHLNRAGYKIISPYIYNWMNTL